MCFVLHLLVVAVVFVEDAAVEDEVVGSEGVVVVPAVDVEPAIASGTPVIALLH